MRARDRDRLTKKSRACLPVGLVALLLLCAAELRAQEEASFFGLRQAAVSYHEFPTAGPAATDGRDLSALRSPGTGSFLVGIDIDSRVTVTFDNQGLRQALVPFLPEVLEDERSELLLTRLRELTRAVAGTERLARTYRREVELYERMLTRPREATLDALDEATRERSEIASQILDALAAAVTARVQQQPEIRSLDAESQADEAANVAAAEIDPIFDDRPAGLPYNMESLGGLLNAEIETVEREVAERLAELGADAAGVEIQIRGHLVRRDGSATAVPLKGHNEEAGCLESTTPRIDFALSAEEQALLAQYELLAQQIRAAQAEGQNVLEAIQTAFEQQQLPIVEALEAVATAVESAGDELEELATWTRGRKLRDWLQGPARTALEESPPVLEAWNGFQSLLEATGSDFEVLEQVAAIGSIRNLRSSDSIQRIVAVLSRLDLRSSIERALDAAVWRGRLVEAQGLFDEAGDNMLEPLAQIDGPIRDWQSATASLEQLRAALEPIEQGAREALATLRGGSAAPVAAELPEPVGQQTRPIQEDLDTEFNLRTVCGGRDEGDELRLTYVFFLDDEELLNASWTDRFRLRFYGWRGVAKASIAMVNFKNAQNADRWEPTTPVSYLLSFSSWPGETASGLGRRHRGSMFTYGFSTMPLDFSEEESVELGLAASVGFFDSFVILGYGVNLQANEEEFFFFSLRPFSLGGLFAPSGPSP